MDMKMSTRVVSALLTNIAMAAVLSVVTTLLTMGAASVAPEEYLEIFATSVVRSLGVSYLIGVVVGIVFPLKEWGTAVAGRFALHPSDGAKFKGVMGAVTNLVYVLILSGGLTFVNTVVIAGESPLAFAMSYLKALLPCYLAGYVVSTFWAPRAEAIARTITHDPLPDDSGEDAKEA